MTRYAAVQCAGGGERKIKYLKAGEDYDVPQLSISSFAQNSLSLQILGRQTGSEYAWLYINASNICTLFLYFWQTTCENSQPNEKYCCSWALTVLHQWYLVGGRFLYAVSLRRNNMHPVLNTSLSFLHFPLKLKENSLNPYFDGTERGHWVSPSRNACAHETHQASGQWVRSKCQRTVCSAKSSTRK